MKKLLPGKPYPQGATWDGVGVNFSIYSEGATGVELCLFEDSGDEVRETFRLTECTGNIWHGYIPGIKSGQLYGSVSTRDIAEAASAAGTHVERNQVLLDSPIKSIGLHPVRIALHPEVVVQVTVNGQFNVTAVKIEASVINAAEKDMLEDLILAAVNDGVRKARDLVSSEMSKITGGLKIPGLMP